MRSVNKVKPLSLRDRSWRMTLRGSASYYAQESVLLDMLGDCADTLSATGDDLQQDTHGDAREMVAHADLQDHMRPAQVRAHRDGTHTSTGTGL